MNTAGDLEYVGPKFNTKPTLCPVCAGKGTVPCLFYADAIQKRFNHAEMNQREVTCRTCNSSGRV